MVSIIGLAADLDLADTRLTGIVTEPGRRMAIFAVNGEKLLRVAEGDAVSGWRIESIAPREVSLSGPGGTKIMQPKMDPNLVPPPGQPPTAGPGGRLPIPPAAAGEVRPPVPPVAAGAGPPGSAVPINNRGSDGRNDTHGSTTDPEARLLRKGLGKEARLCFLGHALMENRNGLIVGAVTTTASGHAERWAALTLIEPHAAPPQPVTLAADKGYDSADFVTALRNKAVTPHVAQNTSGRRSAIDEGTGHAAFPRARAWTSAVVIALPPIPQSPLSTSSTMQKVTWRMFSPSIDTIASVSLLMI